MTLKNVSYINVKGMTKRQKKELGIDETLSQGIVAIETHNLDYKRKGVLIKRGVVNYILNGE